MSIFTGARIMHVGWPGRVLALYGSWAWVLERGSNKPICVETADLELVPAPKVSADDYRRLCDRVRLSSLALKPEEQEVRRDF